MNEYLSFGLIFFSAIGISFLLLYIEESFHFKKLLRELEKERKENENI